MSTTRDHGHVVFECDSCHDVLETGEKFLTDAVVKMKAEGWRAFNASGEWYHYCVECNRRDE